MNVAMPAWTIGAVIALVVLVVAIVLIVAHGNTYQLDLIAALAIARLT